jgi:hypothetical protein
MEEAAVLKELVGLCRLNIDAVRCYSVAVKNIEVYDIREKLSSFLSGHERAVSDLSGLIFKMGGEAPVDMPSRGMLTGRLHPAGERERTVASLRNLEENERVITRLYDDALRQGPGGEAAKLISAQAREETGHLQYLESAIEERLWERLPAYHRNVR